MPFFSFLFLSCTVTLCAFVCVLPFSLFPSLFLSLLSFLSVFPSFLSFPFSFLLSIHPSNLSFLLFFLSYFTRLFFLLHWKSYIILHIPFIHFCLLLLLLPSFTGNPAIVCLSFLSFLSFFLPPSFFPLLCHTPFSYSLLLSSPQCLSSFPCFCHSPSFPLHEERARGREKGNLVQFTSPIPSLQMSIPASHNHQHPFLTLPPHHHGLTTPLPRLPRPTTSPEVLPTPRNSSTSTTAIH